MPESHVEFWNDYLKRDVSFLSLELSGELRDTYFSPLFDSARTFVEPLRGKEVLELGCGDGADAIALALLYGCRVTAIDTSPVRIDLARENCKKHGVDDRVDPQVGDAMNLPFADGAFDGVVANSVMLFLDHDRACAEVARVLRPGGRFVLTNESLAQSPLVLLSRLFGLGHKSKELARHVKTRLSPPRIEELAGKHFSDVSYVLHFGLLSQTFWGVRLVLDRIRALFVKVDHYHKPDVVVPGWIKRLDRRWIDGRTWYANRTWIAAVCFVK
jgi:ubiquinone/menaquinone biosynthesis C-methylase UbiE